MARRGRQNLCALLIFPRHPPGLELAPGRPERIRSRLPWLHRASPSATLHETVVSTDADKLIDMLSSVNSYFAVSSSINHDGTHRQTLQFRAAIKKFELDQEDGFQDLCAKLVDQGNGRGGGAAGRQ